MTTLPAITQGLMPLRKLVLGAGAGAAATAAGGAADAFAGAAGCENKGAGPAAGACDCGSGTPTAGADATGGACIILVKSPGPPPTGGGAPRWGGGAEGALKNAVAPSGLDRAFGFIAPPPDESGPAAGGAMSGEAEGALPDPKPGRLSSEKLSPPRDCGRIDGALKPCPETDGPYIWPSLKVGVPMLGPEIWPEAEMDGPLMPLIPTDGARKVGPLTEGLLKEGESMTLAKGFEPPEEAGAAVPGAGGGAPGAC